LSHALDMAKPYEFDLGPRDETMSRSPGDSLREENLRGDCNHGTGPLPRTVTRRPIYGISISFDGGDRRAQDVHKKMLAVVIPGCDGIAALAVPYGRAGAAFPAALDAPAEDASATDGNRISGARNGWRTVGGGRLVRYAASRQN
jgi:hypothetical protein